jgi:hypothetical protein
MKIGFNFGGWALSLWTKVFGFHIEYKIIQKNGMRQNNSGRLSCHIHIATWFCEGPLICQQFSSIYE